jgi:hypothetical protein
MIPMLFAWKFHVDFDTLFLFFSFFLSFFLSFIFVSLLCLGLQIPKMRPSHPILPFDIGEEIKENSPVHPMATALPYTIFQVKKRERVDKKVKTIILRSFPS